MNLQSLHQQYFDRSEHRDDGPRWTAHSSDLGVVTSAHYLASAAGAEMLHRGGNAMDAAIATSFALASCEPAGSGLGGMATMLVYWADAKRISTVEGPCLAPQSATPEKVAASNRYRGYAAIAVPTQVATMDYAHRQYAMLSLAELLGPAIQIAEEGFPVTATLNRLMQQYVAALRKRPAGNFFLKNGAPLGVGDPLRQPQLANTLRLLAERGLPEFYVGEIGRRIVEDISSGGGFLEPADFETLPQPLHREPIQGMLGQDVVHTVGPPGGGITLVQLAQLFSATKRQSFSFDEPADVVMLARLIQQVRRQRQKFRLKTQADAPGEAAILLDAKYNLGLLAQMKGVESGGETTHVCTVDRWGNAVSLTQSIERSFGSCMVTPDLGFCYNGYLRAFKVENRRHPYYLRPGTPARSNASPTIMTCNGRPRVLIGSTGSERMISGMFCTLLRLFEQQAFAAVHGPRLHCTPEGVVVLEAERFCESVTRALVSSGFQLDVAEPYAFRMGGLQLVLVDDSGVTGVADPRRDGAAICA